MTGAPEISKIDWNTELRRNEAWLKTVIASRLGEPGAVDDVWQEVSMAAFLQKAPINDITKIAPWLYRTAVLQTLLYKRKMGRKRKTIDHFIDEVPQPESDVREPNPLDWMLQQERQDAVREALKRLPDRDRETIMMKYFHNWSYREMAEKMGTSVFAVQSLLHRAREKLRAAIDISSIEDTPLPKTK